MFGLIPHAVDTYGIPGAMLEGSVLAGALFATAMVTAATRLLLSSRVEGDDRDSRFFVFLACIGAFTVLAYGLNKGVLAGSVAVIRYLLFALLLPVALIGAFLLHEQKRQWRRAVCALVTAWAILNVRDNYRLWQQYAVSPPDNNKQVLSDYLVSHHIRYGRADYWDAYAVTFLAREQVILSSTSKVRISAYQSAVDAHADEAVSVIRQPCARGVPVSSWCVVPASQTHSVQ